MSVKVAGFRICMGKSVEKWNTAVVRGTGSQEGGWPGTPVSVSAGWWGLWVEIYRGQQASSSVAAACCVPGGRVPPPRREHTETRKDSSPQGVRPSQGDHCHVGHTLGMVLGDRKTEG